jgi:hypothetical protein
MLPFLAFVVLAQTPEAVDVPFRELAFGSNGKIKDGGAIVLRDERELNAYRVRMGTTDAKKPNVDWSKEQIVALHAAGFGNGRPSLQVAKVRRKSDGTLEIEAGLDRGSMSAVPTTGVRPPLKKEGVYSLIAVERTKGAVNLRIVEPPKD